MVRRHHVREHERGRSDVSDYWRGRGIRSAVSERFSGFRDTFARGGGSTSLTTNQRNSLPSNAFAVPEMRAYPVPTVAELQSVGARRPEVSGPRHALNALQRVEANGSEYEKTKVHDLVRTRYPGVYSEWRGNR